MTPPTGPVPPEHLLEHAAWLRALAGALCRDEHAAADLEQETWLAALRGGAHARDAKAWLGSVARRLAASAGRSAGRRAAREADVAGSRPPEAPDASETLASVELSARLARAVAELDEPYRTTLALRYYEGLPPRRIAQRLGVDERAVESRLRRGREKLREALDRQCGGREVWMGAALALAFASGEGAGRGLSIAALLALLLGGGLASGIAIQRALVESEPGPSVAVELRELEAPGVLAAEELVVEGANVAAQDARAAVDAPQAGVELVVAGEGTPLAGVRVRMRSVAGSRDVTSDAEGRVTFGQVPGAFVWNIDVPATERTRNWSAEVSATAITRLEIPRRGGRIVGSVIDFGGQPVPGAEVSAWADHNVHPDSRGPDRTATADARGRFSMEDMGSGSGETQPWALAAHAVDACSFGRLMGRVDPSQVETEVTLVVERAWHVRGRVTDPSGRPLEGVTLTAYHAQRESRDSRIQSPWFASQRADVLAASDAQGAFELDVVGPDETFRSGWRLQAESPRHRTVWRELEGPGWIDVVLEWGGRLEGVVVDATMRPVAGALVALHAFEKRDPVQTDDLGRFAFEGLTELEGVVLMARAPGHALSVAAVDVRSQGARQTIVLDPECRFSGVAFDANGAPMGGAFLEFEGDREIASAWIPRSRGWTWEVLASGSHVWCDGAGRFAVDGLYPGRFTLRLRRGHGGEVLAVREIELTPGAHAPIELHAGTGLDSTVTVRGRVLDATGAPVAEAGVMATHFVEGETECDLDPEYATTSADGRFEIRGLSPGRWTIGASSWAGGEHRGTPRCEPETYAAGVYEFELRFASPAQR